ncbi:MAG: GatB/YqeY domain-containing protein [Capsulimonadales bacterium]|nr:GatB/YqeY domain-containing protein [Capsulimonadales bacterium]
MTIQQRIDDASREALRQQDRQRRSILSFLLAALKKAAVDARQDHPDDALAVTLLQKLRKQFQETLDSARKGERAELIERTTYEIAVVEEFLPAAPSEEAMRAIVAEEIARLGAASVKEMGKVIAAASARLAGADKARLSAIVRASLTG